MLSPSSSTSYSQNDELKAQLNNMELYVASARAKNWIGDADPIFQTFNDEIIKYVVICSTSYAIRFTKASVIKRLSAIILLSMLKSTLKPRNPGLCLYCGGF